MAIYVQNVKCGTFQTCSTRPNTLQSIQQNQTKNFGTYRTHNYSGMATSTSTSPLPYYARTRGSSPLTLIVQPPKCPPKPGEPLSSSSPGLFFGSEPPIWPCVLANSIAVWRTILGGTLELRTTLSPSESLVSGDPNRTGARAHTGHSDWSRSSDATLPVIAAARLGLDSTDFEPTPATPISGVENPAETPATPYLVDLFRFFRGKSSGKRQYPADSAGFSPSR